MKYVHACPGWEIPCTDRECDNVELETEALSCGICGKVSPFWEDSSELYAKREWIELDDGPVLEKNGERWHVMSWGTTEWHHNQVSEVWCEACSLRAEKHAVP